MRRPHALHQPSSPEGSHTKALDPSACLDPSIRARLGQNAINRGRGQEARGQDGASFPTWSAALQVGPHRIASRVGHRSPPLPQWSTNSRTEHDEPALSSPAHSPHCSMKPILCLFTGDQTLTLFLNPVTVSPANSAPYHCTAVLSTKFLESFLLFLGNGESQGPLTCVSSGTGSSFVRVGGSSATSDAGSDGSVTAAS